MYIDKMIEYLALSHILWGDGIVGIENKEIYDWNKIEERVDKLAKELLEPYAINK